MSRLTVFRRFKAKSRQTKVYRTSRRSNTIVLGLLAGFFITIFWRPIFLREVMVGGDAFYYSFPLRSQAWQILRQGSLPLWTSNLFGGYPLLAMSQVAVGYPLTWGYLFLPAHWAEQIYVAAPFLLAAIFTFFYTRQIGRSALASMLAALSFAYGGFFMPTVNGISTNGVMWLPLMLVAVERARSKKLSQSILLSTVAYTMSVLNGYGQVFLYVGILAIAYSLAVTFFQGGDLTWRRRLRPLMVTIIGIILATGLTAFQTFETWQAVSLSIRQSLDYNIFSEGSFTILAAWKSFIAPRFNMVDVTTYVPLLSFFLVPLAFFQIRKDFRVGFWLTVTLAAFVLMLGANSPIYQLIYRIPLINLFRVPARHSFEWTFALSVLAAYGWDSAARLWKRNETANATTVVRPIAIGCLLLLSILLGIYWTRVEHETSYVVVKLGFTCALLATLWQAFKLTSERTLNVVGGCVVVVACFFEASILFGHLWYPNRQSVANREFVAPAPPTRFLQQFPASEGRVYTDGPHVADTFDSFNLVPYFGLSNVAGYEPAMLLRFSRAMGNVGLDTSQLRRGFSSDGSILEPSSHVLDILNTRYTTTFWDLGDSLDQSVDRDGIQFAATAAPIRLKPRESATFMVAQTEADSLAVVSSLAYANGLPQGERIASIRLRTSSGSVIERELRAGIETAEWAHERPDIRATIRHQLPPIFDSVPGDDRNSFSAHRYLAKIAIGKHQSITKIEIENVSGAQVLLWKLTVFDSVGQISKPLKILGAPRWETVFNQNRVVVLKNNRALPRTWLVSRVRYVTAEEALQAIRGRADFDFDPAQTALVETLPAHLPQLNGESLATSSSRIVALEPNKLVIEAISEVPSLLVVSEISYPGWVAEVDDQPAQIHQTDYLLRGVFLTAGNHRVVMRYTAPAARRGLVLGIFSVMVLGGLILYSRRRG